MNLLLLFLAFLLSISVALEPHTRTNAIVLPQDEDDDMIVPFTDITSAEIHTYLQWLKSKKPPAASNASDFAAADPQNGYAEHITSTNIEAWPFRKGLYDVGNGYKRTIPICFVDERSRDALWCPIMGAVTRWGQAIGGNDETSLRFNILDDESTDFCCTAYDSSDMSCNWNIAKWPRDAVAIHLVDNYRGNAAATVGYIPGTDPGRHYMVAKASVKPSAVAHELGHVLGMVHEHQRWDRDQYIQFNCDKISGFAAALERLRNEEHLSQEEATELLCTNDRIARKYGMPPSWIKGSGLDPTTQLPMDGPGGLDFGSIMMYGSSRGRVKGAARTPENVIMYRFVTDQNGQRVPAPGDTWWIDGLSDNSIPSAGDRDFLRQFYPWDQARYDASHPGSNKKRAP